MAGIEFEMTLEEYQSRLKQMPPKVRESWFTETQVIAHRRWESRGGQSTQEQQEDDYFRAEREMIKRYMRPVSILKGS